MKRNLILASGIVLGGAAAMVATAHVAALQDVFASCREDSMIDFAEIGGAFELTDETGRRVSDAELVSRPTLFYMGYTFCPDVCPLDNMRNAEAVYMLEERGVDAQAVFVSVDPGRDTLQVLTDFTDNFHPEMIGMTGTEEEIARLASDFHAVFEVRAADDEYYLIDHTTFTYLMMPGHGVVDLVSRDTGAEVLAARAQCFAERA